MEFRRSAQRHADAIKACLQFRAPADPLRGDEPARRVRDAAKDALEAIFDNSMPTHGSGGGGGMSGVSGGGGGAGGVGGARIAGMSSSAFPSVLPSSGPRPGGGFSTALPGQPGYDPRSAMHQAPISTGGMVRSARVFRSAASLVWRLLRTRERRVSQAGPTRCLQPPPSPLRPALAAIHGQL